MFVFCKRTIEIKRQNDGMLQIDLLIPKSHSFAKQENCRDHGIWVYALKR